MTEGSEFLSLWMKISFPRFKQEGMWLSVKNFEKRAARMREPGSTDLRWRYSTPSNPGAVLARLRMNPQMRLAEGALHRAAETFSDGEVQLMDEKAESVDWKEDEEKDGQKVFFSWERAESVSPLKKAGLSSKICLRALLRLRRKVLCRRDASTESGDGRAAVRRIAGRTGGAEDDGCEGGGWAGWGADWRGIMAKTDW